jgi:predicted DNA-binding helix-hairpin-helix protein
MCIERLSQKKTGQPVIGVKNVQRILNIRRFHRIRLTDLDRLNVSLVRAKWFIVTADHNPDVFRLDRADLPDIFKRPTLQPSLFEATSAASVVLDEL